MRTATYRVEYYEPSGHQSPPEPPISTGRTLEEARAVIRGRLGLSRLMAARRWIPDSPAVEAYHESSAEGCGGYAIVRE